MVLAVLMAYKAFREQLAQRAQMLLIMLMALKEFKA
jgi:hypothetical protein